MQHRLKQQQEAELNSVPTAPTMWNFSRRRTRSPHVLVDRPMLDASNHARRGRAVFFNPLLRIMISKPAENYNGNRRVYLIPPHLAASGR